MSLHFYRCVDCLSVVTSSELTAYRNPEDYYPRYGQCGACGGRIEYLGETQRDRLVKTGLECPCDGRCTSALGPSCDCRCHGENHGTNRVVEVTRDAGAVPVFRVQPDAKAKAEAYRAIKTRYQDLWNQHYKEVTERKYREYLGGGAFSVYLEGQRIAQAFNHAKALRSHAGRNKAIERLIAELTPKRVAA